MVNAESILHEQRAKVAEIERALEVARAELRGMEALASAIPPSSTGKYGQSRRQGGDSGQKVGGRQPGSISLRWRAILDELYTFSATRWFTVEDTVEVVRRREKREMKPAEVRRQFEKYAELGYINVADDGRYQVTKDAVEKYSMGARPTSDGEDEDAHKENEPESDNASGSETADWGAPTPSSAWIKPQSSWTR